MSYAPILFFESFCRGVGGAFLEKHPHKKPNKSIQHKFTYFPLFCFSAKALAACSILLSPYS